MIFKVTVFPFSVVALLLFSTFSISLGQNSMRYEVYYQWKQIDYNFPNETFRAELIRNGGFIQNNTVLTAIQIYQDHIFIATPRYLPGVPSTLNVINYKKSLMDQVLNRNTGPKLTPFPSWEMQKVGDCSALQMVQAMETDPYGRLWIIDTGRLDLLTSTPRNLCPAKLVIVDLTNGNKIDRVYEFPNKVVSRYTNAFKDMQIECSSRDDCFSYVSKWELYGTTSIVVYDYKNNDSWYATHPSMEPNFGKANITIEGTSLYVPFGITGLGLTPKSTGHSHLFFSKIAGDHVFTVPTSAVRNKAALKSNPNLSNSVIRDLGQKPSGQADGSCMDNRGRWYFGSLPESAIYYTDTNSAIGGEGGLSTPLKYDRLIVNKRNMQWPDGFSFDGAGYLLVSSSRFQIFANLMTNPSEVNYRIIRFKTDSVSYHD